MTMETTKPNPSAPERVWVAMGSLLRGYGYTYLSTDGCDDLIEYHRVNPSSSIKAIAHECAEKINSHISERVDRGTSPQVEVIASIVSSVLAEWAAPPGGDYVLSPQSEQSKPNQGKMSVLRSLRWSKSTCRSF